MLLFLVLLVVTAMAVTREDVYRARRDVFKKKALDGLQRRRDSRHVTVQHNAFGDARSSQRNIVEESHRLLQQGYVSRPTVVRGRPLPLAHKKVDRHLQKQQLVKPHHPPHSDARPHHVSASKTGAKKFVPKATVVKGRPLRLKHSALLPKHEKK